MWSKLRVVQTAGLFLNALAILLKVTPDLRKQGWHGNTTKYTTGIKISWIIQMKQRAAQQMGMKTRRIISVLINRIKFRRVFQFRKSLQRQQQTNSSKKLTDQIFLRDSIKGARGRGSGGRTGDIQGPGMTLDWKDRGQSIYTLTNWGKRTQMTEEHRKHRP